MYKGAKASMLSIPIFNGVQFSSFYYFQNKFQTHGKGDSVIKVNMKASICSGLVATLTTTPLFRLRTRMVTNIIKETSISRAFCQIVKNEGFFGLYKGFSGSLMGLSYPAIQMPLYEYIKSKRQNQSSALGPLIPSVISNVTALALTYPHLIIRTIME